MDNNQISSVATPVNDRLQSKPSPLRRILVVDDEPLIRLLYVKVLVEAGYQTESAENGAVAWQAVQLTDYDLLITDNQMPKVSGVELLKKIYDARISLPVIMATGTFPEEEFTRSPWLQPEIMLLKPHTLPELLEAVEEVFFIDAVVRASSLLPPFCKIRPAANRSQL